jgi:serine/threonine protein phosphatase PrpC
MEVQKDDIIILSSDGLWDVIKGNQLQEIMERNTTEDLQDLADDLLSQAVDGRIKLRYYFRAFSFLLRIYC